MKNFVFDTNVLLHDPDALFKFEDNTVVIPIYVIEEIDQFKKELSERGRNARQVSRYLDTYREKGNLGVGVPLESGGVLRVVFSANPASQQVLNKQLADNLILSVALELQQVETGKQTIFVTKDTNLRVRADAMGLKAVNYEDQVVSLDQLYPGAAEVTIDPEGIDEFFETGELVVDYIPGPVLGQNGNKPIPSGATDKAAAYLKASKDKTDPRPVLYANEYLLLRSSANASQTALGCLNGEDGTVRPLVNLKQGTWGIRPRNKEQHFALDALLNDDISLVTLLGKAGTGKAQPLDARVLTPTGWKAMGQIEPGHQVMTPHGTPATVVGVFPQGEKEIYRVHFTDGTSTECCREHLWYTWTTLNRDQQKPGSVKSLDEIMQSLRYGAQRKRNHSIPICLPLEFPERDLPLDPYLMGVLLGDGSMSVGQLSLSTSDPFIVETCRPLLEQVGCHIGNVKGYDHSICSEAPAGPPGASFIRRCLESGEVKAYASMNDVMADGFGFSSVYRACDGTYETYRGFSWEKVDPCAHSTHPVKNFLIEVGLWGCRSEDKFVPQDFLLGSRAQRQALLQGLMDTDGTIQTGGHTTFTSTSPRLAEDVKFLVQSLGGTARMTSRHTHYEHNGEKRRGRLSYRLHICLPNEVIPFRLPRKVERHKPREKYFPRRYVDCIEYVGRKPAQCILIDHPDHLYLTDDCIVTHNTLMALAAGLHKTTEEQTYHRLLVSRPIFPLGRDIGYLPGTVEEKLNPWMQPIFDNIEYLLGISHKDKRAGRSVNELTHLGILEIEPLTFIRGRSIPHQYMIVDEAQNLTPHEVKTILTRVGEGTKIVLTGDPYQIDNPYVDSESNGLTYTINRFKGQKIAATVTLTKGERSQLAELASNLL